jgi:hypothetical protein
MLLLLLLLLLLPLLSFGQQNAQATLATGLGFTHTGSPKLTL